MILIQASEIRESLPFFLDHFGKMTKDEIYCRFLHYVTPDSIRDWLLSFESHAPFKTWFLVNQETDGVFSCVVQVSQEVDKPSQVEIAISVLPAFQNKGMGFKAIEEALEFARTIPATSAVFNCSFENRSCRQLFSKAGFNVVFDHDQRVFTGQLNV